MMINYAKYTILGFIISFVGVHSFAEKPKMKTPLIPTAEEVYDLMQCSVGDDVFSGFVSKYGLVKTDSKEVSLYDERGGRKGHLFYSKLKSFSIIQNHPFFTLTTRENLFLSDENEVESLTIALGRLDFSYSLPFNLFAGDTYESVINAQGTGTNGILQIIDKCEEKSWIKLRTDKAVDVMVRFNAYGITFMHIEKAEMHPENKSGFAEISEILSSKDMELLTFPDMLSYNDLKNMIGLAFSDDRVQNFVEAKGLTLRRCIEVDRFYYNKIPKEKAPVIGTSIKKCYATSGYPVQLIVEEDKNGKSKVICFGVFSLPSLCNDGFLPWGIRHKDSLEDAYTKIGYRTEKAEHYANNSGYIADSLFGSSREDFSFTFIDGELYAFVIGSPLVIGEELLQAQREGVREGVKKVPADES